MRHPRLQPAPPVVGHPPGSEVVAGDRAERPSEECGHKLYVVKAEARSVRPGAAIAAGLGWLQWGDGRGVFVEHAVESADAPPAAVEAQLVAQITTSLQDLAASRGVAFAEEQVGSRVVVAEVGPRPTCALVVAVYQAEGWSHDASGSPVGARR